MSGDKPFPYAEAAPERHPIEGLLLMGLSRGRGQQLYRLEASIKDVGLLRAPMAARTESGRPIVLSGARRVQALKNLGRGEAPLIFLEPRKGEKPCWAHPEDPRARLFPSQVEIALVENVDRGFNPAELAIAASLLKATPDSLLKNRLLALLGLSSPQAFADAAEAAELPDPFLDALAQGVMDLGNARAMKGWAESEKAALLQLFMRLKPSFQKRRQWAEWLGDIKARDGADLKAFLQERFGGFATQQREEEARGELFAARFPKLAATLRRQSELIKSLSLPDGITLTFDSTLEDPAAVFRLDFSSLEHLREQLTELLAIVSSSARLNKIFLSESPDP